MFFHNKPVETGMVIVDYIQLMFGEPKEIVTALYDLSVKINAPVVVVSQVSRTLEERSDKRPTENDLLWESTLNSVFRKMMFVYRESYYDREYEESADRSDAEVIEIDKEMNRRRVLKMRLDRKTLLLEDAVAEGNID